MKEPNEGDHDPVQIDYYGLRLSAKPARGDYDTPSSWRAVWRQANAELRGIVQNTIAILGDAVKAVRNLIRGIGGLPSPYAARVQAAHERADHSNDTVGISSDIVLQRASAKVRDIIRKKQLEGYTVRVYTIGDNLIFVFLPPLADAEVRSIAEDVAALMPAADAEK